VIVISSITRFEDIEAWKKSRELTKEIYRITASGEFSRDFGLRDQIRRASVSILSNIAEGYERNGNRGFQHFLSVAKGSAGEVRAQLYVALDAGFIHEELFISLRKQLEEISRLLGGLMKYLKISSELRVTSSKLKEQLKK
jgi:four helix bundle protein